MPDISLTCFRIEKPFHKEGTDTAKAPQISQKISAISRTQGWADVEDIVLRIKSMRYLVAMQSSDLERILNLIRKAIGNQCRVSATGV